ncbi:MAG TPA: site-2 protease family protein [Lentisphaeria bacterium]|jgi:Zn-dependent protease|nr:site-2 protease family protein [Lentisphaeria bacterium]
MGMFVSMAVEDPHRYMMWVLCVIFSICLHEFAHAIVAKWQGDTTAEDMGHLTLNPMIQMGPMALIILCLAGIAWGAVPVDPRQMRHRYSHALVAFAGPAMNLLLWVLGVLGFVLAMKMAPENQTLHMAFFQLASLNLLLALFNLIPASPLDGWTVAAFFFPKLEQASDEVKGGITIGLFALAFISPMIGFLYNLSGDVSWAVGSFLLTQLS